MLVLVAIFASVPLSARGVSNPPTARVPKYYRPLLLVGHNIKKSHFVEAGRLGEKFLRTTSVPAPTKQLANALDRSAQNSATRSQVQQISADEVPIGILEVPIGVWGSRRAASVSGQPGRIEVFAEETCTVLVFPHGAVIRLSAAVAPGQMMMVANRNSSQVVPCRVVKARNYPNVRGYAEIEFFRSTNNFWGDYVPQGMLRLTPATPSAAEEGFSEDFWSNGVQEKAISALAKAWSAAPAAGIAARSKVDSIESRTIQNASVKKAAQPAPGTPKPTQQPQRDESTERSWIVDLLAGLRDQVITPTATDRRPSPRSTMAFAWVAVTCLFLMVGTGFLLRHRGAMQSAASVPIDSGASAVSPTANTSNGAQPESSSTAAPGVPVSAKTENFPGSQTPGFAYNARASRSPEKSPTIEQRILNGKPLAAPLVARRSATALGRDVPPNPSAMNSNTGAATTPAIFAALLAPGGRVKEPRLVLSSVPSYPATAKRVGIEGEVTVSAVIDINGKLTGMKVISGSPLLRQAALDSLRTWKYEPALLNDRPVPVQTSVTVKFRLR